MQMDNNNNVSAFYPNEEERKEIQLEAPLRQPQGQNEQDQPIMHLMEMHKQLSG